MATALPRSKQWKLGTLALLPYDIDVTNNVTIGGTLAVTGVTTFTVPAAASNATGITAFATGGQASATALTKSENNVTTCATDGDSVKLPTAVAGLAVTVINNGAAPLAVFPATGGAINALAVNLSVSIPVGGRTTFRAINTVTWYTGRVLVSNATTTQKGSLVIKAGDSAGNTETTLTNASQAAARTYTFPDAGASANVVLSEGAATVNGIKTFGSMFRIPYNGSVAAAGTTATDAAALAEGLSVVTGANGTVGVKLPTPVAGSIVIIKGTTAGVLKVWPGGASSGVQINALGADAAMSLASGAIPAWFIAISATQYYTFPLLPS